jgi:hypothetical protein
MQLLMCSPVRIDFSDQGHGDREIDEFTIGHSDFKRLGQDKRRDFIYESASTFDCDIFLRVKKLTAPSYTPLGLNSWGAVTV